MHRPSFFGREPRCPPVGWALVASKLVRELVRWVPGARLRWRWQPSPRAPHPLGTPQTRPERARAASTRGAELRYRA
mgnify:CR=1 FL=1